MNQSPKDLKEWQKQIKEKWDEQRKQVIFEGNGGIIYPPTPTTQSTPQHSTTQTTTTVNVTIHDSDKNAHVSTADAETLIKIIGITIASLLVIIIIGLIIIRVCRQSVKKKNKRISLRRPLQSEEPDHIYAEIEPLNRNDIESPSTSSGAVALPTKKQKRRLGASSIRYVSMRIGRLFGRDSKRSATDDSIFFSKQSESVQAPPLPSVPDFPNGDRKGKRRAARQKLPSASRPLLDADSQMSSTSSDVLVEMRERENVYNPLTRHTDSGPYDHLKLGKTGSDAHITDEGAPGSPHDYFVLEKEKEPSPQNGDKKSHLYFILEKEEEDRLDKDFSPKATELEGLEEDDCNTKSDTIHTTSPDENCESKKDHDYFVLESTASSASSNPGKGLNTPFKDSAGQTSKKSSSPQHQMNTESSRASYELAKNVSNLDDNQNLSDEESSSTPSSSPRHKTHSGIHQKKNIPNYICIGSSEHLVNNFDDEASKEKVFAEDSSKGGHNIDQKDSKVCGSNVDTGKKNTSSDDYMEPLKLKTLSEYLEINPLVPERTTSKQKT